MVILYCFCMCIVYLSLKKEKPNNVKEIENDNKIVKENKNYKYIIINKKHELYDCKNDCFVKDFTKNCICDESVAKKYYGNYDYNILPTSEKRTNFKIFTKKTLDKHDC